jgi:lon-related putative ATP-dependent protease
MEDLMTKISALPPDKLRRVFDPKELDFSSTEELSSLDEVIGQERAVRAVSFGIDIESPGYNMYALGPVGTGKTTTIKKFLQRKAEDQPVPDDWLYVNNFDDPDKPKALRLPAGKGCEFEKDIQKLVEDMEAEVPQAFESDEYDTEQERIQEEFQQKRQELFQVLEEKAKQREFTLLQTPAGIVLAPVVQGEVLRPDQFSKLDENTRQEIEQKQEELQDEFRDTMRKVRQIQQNAKERIRELDRQVVGFAVEHLLEALCDKYSEYEEVIEFLDAVREDILDNVQAFKRAKQMEEAQQQMPIPIALRGQQLSFDKYRVNLIVDNCETKGAPVILESNPTYQNLIGRIEHQAQLGALVTNFMMIKGGALHRANGGYLMVEARDVLLKPLAWEALKRALKDQEVQIESMREYYGAISTRTLDPEPIPLDIKVVVVGDPMIYYLLYQLDEDFQELFKVKADFAIQTEWDSETINKYTQFISTICREEKLLHFDPSGVAKVIERSARMVSDQKKLATKFGEIVDLVRESNYWASKNEHNLIQAEDVKKAIQEKIYRSNRIEERLQEMIDEETILIDTEGEIEGQVNGISVLMLGDYAFGKPSRITTRTHVGNAGVVNIERETELGGRIHNKGVMILTGYLGGKYANEVPLALSAHITFEQSYSEVEGDSASSAELYAMLSSLSGFPIRQDLAVTGSVNQRGQIQAIGGVNEKIEGFFDVCRIKGLTGEQGVMIPKSNVHHLMLREDVIAAAKEGKFHIYPISTIDEGIALLTGKDAGERQLDNTYPEGSVNWAVQQRLNELAEKVKAFGRMEKASADGHKKREPA